jgi:hypothetical protein
MQGTMCGEQRSSSAIGYCACGRGASSPPCDEEGMGALGSSYLRSRGTQRGRRPRRLGPPSPYSSTLREGELELPRICPHRRGWSQDIAFSLQGYLCLCLIKLQTCNTFRVWLCHFIPRDAHACTYVRTSLEAVAD